jgi:hypothetical protein
MGQPTDIEGWSPRIADLKKAFKEWSVDLSFPGTVSKGRITLALYFTVRSSPEPSEDVKSLEASEPLPDETCLFIESLSRQTPEKAFEIAFDSLGRSAEMMKAIIEETRRDLIEIGVRRKQIDRTQARTREILDELIERAR